MGRLAPIWIIFCWLGVLGNLVSDALFLSDCRQPKTLDCITYTARPTDWHAQESLANRIRIGAWACIIVVSIEFAVSTFNGCLAACLNYPSGGDYMGDGGYFYWMMCGPGFCCPIEVLGIAHDIIQVFTARYFILYIGGGSFFAALSMFYSIILLLFRYIKALFLCNAFILAQYGEYSGKYVWLSLPIWLGGIVGYVFFYIAGISRETMMYNLSFTQGFDWRRQPDNQFQHSANMLLVDKASGLATLNVSGKAMYWYASTWKDHSVVYYRNIFAARREENGPLFMLTSSTVRDATLPSSRLSTERGQSFYTTIKLARGQVIVDLLDPNFMNVSSPECLYNQTVGRSPYTNNVLIPLFDDSTSENSVDFCLIASLDTSIFRATFPYDITRETTFREQSVKSAVPILCPQPPDGENNYTALVEAGARVGLLRSIKVGLSMTGVHCGRVPASFVGRI